MSEEVERLAAVLREAGVSWKPSTTDEDATSYWERQAAAAVAAGYTLAPAAPATPGVPDEARAVFERQMARADETHRQGWELVRRWDQTILSDPDAGAIGNCMQAAVASLLDLPLDEVPHFAADFDDWETAMDRWASSHGYAMVRVGVAWLDAHPGAPVLLCGTSPRGISHAVVGRGLDVIHDPHPSRSGLTSRSYAFLFAAAAPGGAPEPVVLVADLGPHDEVQMPDGSTLTGEFIRVAVGPRLAAVLSVCPSPEAPAQAVVGSDKAESSRRIHRRHQPPDYAPPGGGPSDEVEP